MTTIVRIVYGLFLFGTGIMTLAGALSGIEEFLANKTGLKQIEIFVFMKKVGYFFSPENILIRKTSRICLTSLSRN
ncbi:MAG: hypothetical protein KAT07_13345 [Calditrichia bacterium]|nr:hypothetical protein [Calditrichia bacterium]